MTDTIVVGAGIGGLAAAISAAAAGRSVVVFEAASRPGGKAGVTMIDGLEVDTGPSVLTMPDVFAGLLSSAGMSLDRELRLIPSNPGFRYVYPDGAVLDVFHERAHTLDSVRRTLGEDAAREMESFLAYAEGIWEAAAPNFVYGDAPGWRTIVGGGLATLSQISRVDPFGTMWGAIKKRVRSPHLRKLLARYATYNGSDVRRAPATLNCISHVELALGGYGVTGGMYELVRALVCAAERLGVRIHCDAPVRRITTAAREVTGVELADGTLVVGDSVIANADVSAVATHLLPADGGHGLRPAQNPSMSGYTTIVKAAMAPRVAHTVVFPDDYMQEFEDVFDADRPPSDPTVYVCAQRVCHGRTSWAAHEPLFVMANAPAEPADGVRDPAVWDPLEQRMLARLRGVGLIGADDAVVWRRSPRELAARFQGSRGAIYGSASNNTMAAFQRPSNRVSGLRGLYLASGSAHPGGGVPLAALSGVAAARALAQDMNLRRAG